MAARGCGASRTQGGIYAMSKLKEGGAPIEHFLIDPPIKLHPDLGVTPLGVSLITDKSGVTHILDWVGSQHYPNVADFIEETRRLGLSRRLPSTLDYSRLTKQSRWIGIHARAYIENTERYWEGIEARECPCQRQDHAEPDPPPMCVQLYWHDVDGGVPHTNDSGPRTIVRTMPSFTYYTDERPKYAEPLYAPAMFLRLPLTGIDVVRAKDGSHNEKADKASASQLPVHIEEE